MIRVIALGHPARGDDGAALEAAARLKGPWERVMAGRPGPGLLDLLDPAVPTVLMDVVVSGAPAGTLHEIPLEALPDRLRRQARASSHGLGPADAIALGRVLQRPLPPGVFIGLEGLRFEAGSERSPAVEAALDAWAAKVEETCTKLEWSIDSSARP